jgi:hypothetical protein
MVSDIFKACEDGDINLLIVLIDTSPSGSEINPLEVNGNTPLHIACKKGHLDIVRLLLYKYNVDPDKLNIDSRTAYQEASNDKIRQLFHRLKTDKYRFCTDENTKHPLEIIHGQNPSKSHWLEHFPNDSPIVQELYYGVLDQQRTSLISIINMVRSFFGNDPYKKQLERWTIHIQSLIDQSLISSPSEYIRASELLQNFENSGDIKHLLKLYTLHKDFCLFIGKDQHNTNCFYAPIDYHLYTVENRSYQGYSYRGLTMTKDDFSSYKYALDKKGSYIRTNTFCSTSIDLLTARFFADSGDIINEKVKVITKFHFIKPCSTAIILFENLPHFKSISNYDNELEILIFPGTIFSVKDIEIGNETQFPMIHLEHYNTDEQQGEMAQERLQSFIDSCILD